MASDGTEEGVEEGAVVSVGLAEGTCVSVGTCDSVGEIDGKWDAVGCALDEGN